jgi:hypothetical protein
MDIIKVKENHMQRLISIILTLAVISLLVAAFKPITENEAVAVLPLVVTIAYNTGETAFAYERYDTDDYGNYAVVVGNSDLSNGRELAIAFWRNGSGLVKLASADGYRLDIIPLGELRSEVEYNTLISLWERRGQLRFRSGWMRETTGMLAETVNEFTITGHLGVPLSGGGVEG